MTYATPFRKTAHQRCDAVGKAAIAAFLEQQGYLDVQINPDPKGVDILAINPKGKREYHEVGMKEKWFKEWPDSYKTCNVAGRKQRYFDMFPVHAIVFWEVSNGLHQARRIPGRVAKKHGTTPHDNWRVQKTKSKKKEPMFQLPLEECPLVDLNLEEETYIRWLQLAKSQNTRRSWRSGIGPSDRYGMVRLRSQRSLMVLSTGLPRSKES